MPLVWVWREHRAMAVYSVLQNSCRVAFRTKPSSYPNSESLKSQLECHEWSLRTKQVVWMTSIAWKSLIPLRLKDWCHQPPSVSLHSLAGHLQDLTWHRWPSVNWSQGTLVCSSHGKNTRGTTTLPKPRLCDELIAWEYSSRLVTSATLGQKS